MTARDQWLESRRSGIGGSDAAAILGLSPWATPLSVYLDKRGEAPEKPDNDSMLWGRLLEPVIRQRYSEATGRIVRLPDPPPLLRHAFHPWMIGTPDGITDDLRLLEVKTARSGADWGEPGTDEVPEYYIPQVQHYLAVTGLPVADVAVLIGGSDFRIYTVEADVELQGILIDAEAAFWRCVESGTPPPPMSAADVIRLHPKDSGASVAATWEVEADIARALELRHAIAELESELEGNAKAGALGVMDRIKTFMGEAAVLSVAGKPAATWKASKDSAVTDWKAVATALNAPAELIASFTTTRAGSRRFIFK